MRIIETDSCKMYKKLFYRYIVLLEANKNISATTDEVVLHPGSLTVETPRKAGLGWPEGFDNYTRSAGKGTDLVRLPVRFLKINQDIAIWSAPVELFCEVSNEIRDSSPFPYTFYYGYTNGWMGYLLSDQEYKHAGYELTVSPFSPSAAKDLTEGSCDISKRRIEKQCQRI